MENNSSFETVKISLDKELSGFDDNVELGAGNWISFGYIPSNVTVYFALDNNSNSKIKALQGLQIQAKHDKVYLWSVGTNATEQMEVMHWGSDNTKLIMPPRSDFESLNSYGTLARQQMQDIANNAILSSTALAQFDKIINPYYLPTITTGMYSGTAQADILSKTLSCDKIKINISIDHYANTGGTVFYSTIVVCEFDGNPLLLQAVSTGTWTNDNCYADIENCKGKQLRIFGSVGNVNYEKIGYTIQEYTLK